MFEALSDTCVVAAAQMREAAGYAQKGDGEATLVLISEVIELLRTGASSPAGNAHAFEDLSRQNRRATLSVWRARKIATEIESRLSLPLRVCDLARAAGFSDSHFSRAFKSYFGVTARLYITIRRIRTAQELMLSTTLSLAEIALRCGMFDQAHFTRAFRRVVGETPNRWRRSRPPEYLRASPLSGESTAISSDLQNANGAA
jgi:AraC-like DNA-binding protein